MDAEETLGNIITERIRTLKSGSLLKEQSEVGENSKEDTVTDTREREENFKREGGVLNSV